MSDRGRPAGRRDASGTAAAAMWSMHYNVGASVRPSRNYDAFHRKREQLRPGRPPAGGRTSLPSTLTDTGHDKPQLAPAIVASRRAAPDGHAHDKVSQDTDGLAVHRGGSDHYRPVLQLAYTREATSATTSFCIRNRSNQAFVDHRADKPPVFVSSGNPPTSVTEKPSSTTVKMKRCGRSALTLWAYASISRKTQFLLTTSAAFAVSLERYRPYW